MMSKQWRVLVIDDDVSEQAVVESLLEHYQINVDVAGNEPEALVFLAAQDYTAIIIDLSLPITSGWHILSTILNNPRTAHIPCFAITAYHSGKVEQEALEAGFMAYFPKPINLKTFVDDLRYFVGA